MLAVFSPPRCMGRMLGIWESPTEELTGIYIMKIRIANKDMIVHVFRSSYTAEHNTNIELEVLNDLSHDRQDERSSLG